MSPNVSINNVQPLAFCVPVRLYTEYKLVPLLTTILTFIVAVNDLTLAFAKVSPVTSATLDILLLAEKLPENILLTPKLTLLVTKLLFVIFVKVPTGILPNVEIKFEAVNDGTVKS